MTSSKCQAASRGRSAAVYKNKAPGGRNNLAGVQIARLRQAAVPRMSQRALADELLAFAEFFQVPAQDLLKP